MAPASLHGASIYLAPAPLHGASICMVPFSLQGALITGACSLCKTPSGLHGHPRGYPKFYTAPAHPPGAPAHPPGAPASPCARRQLHPTHGGLRVFPQPGGQLPQRRGVPKETLRSSPGRSSERPTPTQRPTRRSPSPARHIHADDARRASRSASQRTKTHTPTARNLRSARQLANTEFYFASPLHRHADRRSMRINLKCALRHDHILHCRCTRRFRRGTPSPAPSLQCDVHWCTRFHVA